MNYLTSVMILASATLFAACGTSVHATRLNHAPRPMQPRPVESVEVYASGPPPRATIDIAFLEAEQASSWSMDKTPELISELRHKAAELGCDAVVIGGTGSRDPGLRDTESWLVENPKERKSVYGTCVMYADEMQSSYAR
ncbi:MAG: hypothetical protein Tsb0020_03390 [Haliangiales bacterium]